MTTPEFEKARRSINRAREMCFVFGFIALAGSFCATFLLTLLPQRRFSLIYNQAWLKDRFSAAATPVEKDRVVYTLLDAIATMDHYYFVGGIILLALAMLTSLFAFTLYRYTSSAAAHLKDRD